ncbi:hypothetical protein QBE52_05645 [Clostridiaceae bacterium 35-E11]
MEDKRNFQEIIHQVNGIDKNNLNNMEYVTSIDLLLTSDNNGTVKDHRISDQFHQLKEKMEETNRATKEFVEILRKNE